MEKLTLEHLAPYLPYGLKVQYQGITNLQELADHNKKEPKGDFLSIGEEYEEWLKNTPSEKIGDRISVIKRIHFYKHHIRLYVGKRHGYLKLVSFNQIKPILRPLSDLTKEIEHNGERFVPVDIFFPHSDYDKDFDRKVDITSLELAGSINFKYSPYFILNNLFEWHFDVFGLIDAGLAVDMNTLEGGSNE